MSHWSDLPEARIPDKDDSWDRPRYDALAALSPAELLRVAWNLENAHGHLEMEALNLAQDLSCEFEMCNYGYVKEEFRHEESVRRQEAGIRYMAHAYEIAGFSKERREAIASLAVQFTSAHNEPKGE